MSIKTLSKSVTQDCAARVSSKRVKQGRLTKVSNKRVRSECPTRALRTSAKAVCQQVRAVESCCFLTCVLAFGFVGFILFVTSSQIALQGRHHDAFAGGALWHLWHFLCSGHRFAGWRLFGLAREAADHPPNPSGISGRSCCGNQKRGLCGFVSGTSRFHRSLASNRFPKLQKL